MPDCASCPCPRLVADAVDEEGGGAKSIGFSSTLPAFAPVCHPGEGQGPAGKVFVTALHLTNVPILGTGLRGGDKREAVTSAATIPPGTKPSRY
ncbi:hypothetical protein GCM10011380_13360 [Sphingomonas metalli]|uniref:Uncharacterized protein n=1 Tax=Sphingomonas metalli TaxID=1779358 RepID=A0A916T0Z0_9SPHN|nr:hypothetical protein GCM10011380_13360 [Sphingomonas metalli]